MTNDDMHGHQIPGWAWKAGFDTGWHFNEFNDTVTGMKDNAVLMIDLINRPKYTLLAEINGTGETKVFVESDDAADVLNFLGKPTPEFIAWKACGEVLDDADGGEWFALADIKCFEDLHDYVDANGYGGAFEKDAPGWTPDGCDCDFWNEVQERVDAWIKNGFNMEKAPVPFVLGGAK